VTAAAFDADRAYRLHEQVALRPEPFGALAYHYGNRRLNFLRAKELVTLVESLADHDSVQAAFDASQDRSSSLAQLRTSPCLARRL
jgi:putative mycofactocin binding protein MftB